MDPYPTDSDPPDPNIRLYHITWIITLYILKKSVKKIDKKVQFHHRN